MAPAMELETTLGLAVTSFAAWSALYGLVCTALPGKCREWRYRTVVLAHALVAQALSVNCGRLRMSFTSLGGESSLCETNTMITCLGYFLFDFSWCAWYFDSQPRILHVHHLVSIVGLAASLVTGVSGAEVGACIFLAELTNPLLQARWFLRGWGLEASALYNLNDALIVVLFVLVRTVLGTWFLCVYVTHPAPGVALKLSGLALYLISLVLLGRILRVCWGRVNHRRTSGDTTGAAAAAPRAAAAKAD